MNKIKEFEKELAFIKNPVIREFAEKAIEDLPDYFFSVPASSSGKYHPAYTTGEGGLVKHTRAAMRIAIELFRMEMFNYFTDDEKDLILTCLAVHDGRKSGEIQQKYTVAEHPKLQVFAIQKNDTLKSIISDEYLDLVCQGIEAHMGQWNKDYKTGIEILPKPTTKMQKFIHLADYLASRKMLEMNFDVEISKD